MLGLVRFLSTESQWHLGRVLASRTSQIADRAHNVLRGSLHVSWNVCTTSIPIAISNNEWVKHKGPRQDQMISEKLPRTGNKKVAPTPPDDRPLIGPME